MATPSAPGSRLFIVKSDIFCCQAMVDFVRDKCLGLNDDRMARKNAPFPDDPDELWLGYDNLCYFEPWASIRHVAGLETCQETIRSTIEGAYLTSVTVLREGQDKTEYFAFVEAELYDRVNYKVYVMNRKEYSKLPHGLIHYESDRIKSWGSTAITRDPWYCDKCDTSFTITAWQPAERSVQDDWIIETYGRHFEPDDWERRAELDQAWEDAKDEWLDRKWEELLKEQALFERRQMRILAGGPMRPRWTPSYPPRIAAGKARKQAERDAKRKGRKAKDGGEGGSSKWFFCRFRRRGLFCVYDLLQCIMFHFGQIFARHFFSL